MSILSAGQLSFYSGCSYLASIPQPDLGTSVLLCWFLEFAPTESLGSHCLPVTLLLRKISKLHTDPGSPGTPRCQAWQVIFSCPGLTSYILFYSHKCDLEIGVFAYLYVWMRCLVATSTCARSSFRRLVLCFISQNLLPYRFSEERVCSRIIYQFCPFCFLFLCSAVMSPSLRNNDAR